MRPIDADTLKQNLANLVVGGEKAIEETASGTNWINGIHTAYREIDNMPTIDFLGYWIPVEERLPEKSGWYAVCVEKYGRLTLELSLHVEGEPWCADNAVAWLPLPNPYEVKNNE